MKQGHDFVAKVRDALTHARQLPSNNEIIVEPIKGRLYARIGYENSDLVLILPGVKDQPSKPIRLSRLIIDYNVQCKVKEGSSETEENVTIVRLLSPTEYVQDLFIEIVAILIRPIPRFNQATVDDMIRGLIDLFRAMESPSDSTLLGLWGELFLIGNAHNPTTVGEAWHPSPQEKFDFSLGDVRVEVKTTAGPRRHHFSLEQVRPTPGLQMMVASLIVTESADGLNVVQMIPWVLEKINDRKIADQIEKTALKTIGSAQNDHSLAKFDKDSARLALRFYEASTVPQPIQPNLGVSQVRFVSDLQLIPPTDRAKIRTWGELGRGLVGK